MYFDMCCFLLWVTPWYWSVRVYMTLFNGLETEENCSQLDAECFLLLIKSVIMPIQRITSDSFVCILNNGNIFYFQSKMSISVHVLPNGHWIEYLSSFHCDFNQGIIWTRLVDICIVFCWSVVYIFIMLIMQLISTINWLQRFWIHFKWMNLEHLCIYILCMFTL